MYLGSVLIFEVGGKTLIDKPLVSLSQTSPDILQVIEFLVDGMLKFSHFAKGVAPPKPVAISLCTGEVASSTTTYKG